MMLNRKLGLLLGLAALCATAAPLNAATAAGKFTLPQDTYWAGALLPAGTYTFSLDHLTASLEDTLVIRQGTKGIAFVLLDASSDATSSDHSSMLIVDHRVRALHLASVGTTYYFPGHKHARELGAGGGIVDLIPVLTK